MRKQRRTRSEGS